MRAWRLAYAPVRSLHTSRAALSIEELLPPGKDADVVISGSAAAGVVCDACNPFTTHRVGAISLAGRSWRASELRMKSFKELHQLWFVLLKEKSRLMSDREALVLKRGWSGAGRMRKVKESMARLKTVLRERALV